jgi:hypothetical protein
MDFSELLELLDSLSLLPEKEGYWDPATRIPYALVHDVFEAVNNQAFRDFHFSAGQGGDSELTELVFEVTS